MHMIELSLTYWHKLAEQSILICSLLAGFSITVIATMMTSEMNHRLSRHILRAATLAAGFFLVGVFGMTKILLMTTEGYPFPVTEETMAFPRIVSIAGMFSGLISIMTVISLAGWTKSRSLGRFCTAVSIVTLLMFLALG